MHEQARERQRQRQRILAASVTSVAFFLIGVAACNTSPPKEAPRETADAAASSSTTAPTTSAPATGGTASSATPASSAFGAASCSSDADCRTWSSYCNDAPCVCRVLAKDQPNPTCSSQVTCFANPCMKKTAACQGGRCQLVIGMTK